MSRIAQITPEQLLAEVEKPGSLMALFVGRGTVHEHLLAELDATLRIWSMRDLRFFVVQASTVSTIRDNRVTTVRIPQVRLFNNGKLMKSYVGVEEIEGYFNSGSEFNNL